MRSILRILGSLAVIAALAVAANAQTIDLSAGGANPVWQGVENGSRAGLWMDLGAVNTGDTRRDLLIGAPGGPGLFGRVYVIFGGPDRTGTPSLSSADTIITGSTVGDLFGTATAIGNITNVEGTPYPTLAVSAPGALGGRGAVYLFNTAFTSGTSLTPSSATVEILGAAGDQLGLALATADLNNDGYRELIIGGKDKVYIIGGGAHLPSVIDLSTSPVPAAAVYPYAGLGSVLAAGDIDGDGIYDLLVGQPASNVVYVLKGRNGVMPSGPFDLWFTGVDPGDAAGSTIRLLDLDGDGIRDIAISAPNGDGPDNTRTDAGEVYVIYGGPGLTSRSLALADVTFYGRAAGEHFGTLLTAGDINRDRPNDLVAGSQTDHGGAGSVEVYYGRSRSSIGTARADGTRYVDFGTTAADRSILGDTAGGTINAVQVYEVTGEGARDVIVGMAGHSSSAGAVYFTLSPRLDLGTSAVALSGYQGIVSSSPVPVTNISGIPITWATSSNQPWLNATPSGSTSVTTPGSVVINVNGSGLAPGTYTGTITVTSTSIHLTMSQNIAVTFTVRESEPNPSTPPSAGGAPGAVYDILWRSSTDGWLAFWHMNGMTLTGMSLVSINQMTDTNWRIAGFADLDGDGQKDIVWQHSSGWLAAWLLKGSTVVATGYLSNDKVDPSWKLKAVGDLNGDGRADLVWQSDDGALAVWFMNGFTVINYAWLSIDKMADTNWQIVAAGDVDGDGHADIIWQDKVGGGLGVWLMNGSTVLSGRNLSTPKMTDPGWTIVGAVDVNGDGKADLLWQYADGHVATWLMSAEQVLSGAYLNPSQVPNTAWKIAGPK